MIKLYFVTRNGKDFLWQDGKFYPAFMMSPFAVNEETALKYKSEGFDIEYVKPEDWPSLYLHEAVKEDKAVKEPRRTYIRCAVFALAAVLDRLYDSEHVRNVWISLEDGDFLVSFEYRRDYERPAKGIPQSCDSPKEAK